MYTGTQPIIHLCRSFYPRGQGSEFFDNPLPDCHIFRHRFPNIVKNLFVTNRLYVVFHCLVIDGQAHENQIVLTQGQSVILDGVGIVGVFNDEFIIQPFRFTIGQRPTAVKFSLFRLI